MEQIKKPTFRETVDVLVKAYLNDTLQHGWCSACAVGNLVAHARGVRPERQKNFFSDGTWAAWSDVFMTGRMGGIPCQKINLNEYKDEAKAQIEATGYTLQELARIELAFEKCNPIMRDTDISDDDISDEDESMFRGLMAVVDVLAEIHGVDLAEVENAKLLFVREG